MQLCRRPGFGQLGTQIKLLANYFAIQFLHKEKLVVHQYDVEINHPVPSRKIDKDDMRSIFWKCIMGNREIFEPGRILFDDSKCCYSLDQLRFPGGVKRKFTVCAEMHMDARPRDYKVAFQYTGSHLVKNLDETTIEETSSVAIQVVDLLLSQGIRCPELGKSAGWYPFKQSIYRMPSAAAGTVSLGGGREIWSGVFSAAKIGQNWKPLLNVDVSNSAFMKRQSVIEFLEEMVNGEFPSGRGVRGQAPRRKTIRDIYNPQMGLDPAIAENLKRSLKGLKLKTKHMSQNRAYRFQEMQKPASQLKFQLGDGQQISVADYFAAKYGPLQFPHLPCLHVGPKAKMLYIPMEHMEVYSPQKVMKKLTDQQTATMIRQSARSANERKEAINELVHGAQLEMDPFMEAFGVNMNMAMVNVAGRVLTSQKLQYKSTAQEEVRSVGVDNGQWSLERQKFHNPATCEGYSLIVGGAYSPESERMLENFCLNLVQTCKTLGMTFDRQYPDVVLYVNGAGDIQDALVQCQKGTKANYGDGAECKLVLVVMNRKDARGYEVKYCGDVCLGLMTQVILLKNVQQIASPKGRATAENLAMKINMKLGGVNCKLNIDSIWSKFEGEQNGTLFLGIDVTHPGAGDTTSPSIGAIVGNIDFDATKYGASIKAQPHRKEHIMYLQDVAKERILQYHQRTYPQTKPRRIIVFRDGVSESQFQQVLREEMNGIRAACKGIQEDYEPPITYIVVQKRHHTRFFCQNPREAVGRCQNVPPGTTVDTTVTHPAQFDFFLCSHFGIQGTSRPTHYNVLHDDSSFSVDELQMMTYQLCHLYGRCTRVVSIPAPVYYADLCCTRAMFHYKSVEPSSSSSAEGPRHGSDVSSSEAALMNAVKVNDTLKDRMYFS